MNDRAKRDAEIFTEALSVPVEKRPAFLDQACAGDGQLRQKLEALLNTHEQIGDFLEEPPDGAVGQARVAAMADEKPLDRIGRYKLLQQIGEGGCGVVFMAEQEEPVRRRVALKIIKPGMDTKSVIARFEAERQALALMNHPCIAKVFDAGSTDSGRPYFVMELVRGVSITEYCDAHSLTTEERLNLFIQVCGAIQHAHQKGIIHRDVKPSNILVTTALEGGHLPVVIDFGIAKPTMNQRLTDKTVFTAFEMFIGTPAYISPEQAAVTSVDVDTRTDIYSLGVLLYELLTGSKPFDTAALLKIGIDEIRRVIREEEPARPSTRLNKLKGADLATVAERRKSEPPRLIRTIRGDLDWIVMKALEKDRSRRYETANGLALDVSRFLTREAILARPPSKLYRIGKTIQRNKLLFCGIAIIAMLLFANLIMVRASLAKERQARREAEAEKQKAQTAAAKSQQVTRFLEEMLQGVGPSVARGRDTAMLREILDRTAEEVGREMADQPEVEADLSNLIGTLYQRIGSYRHAEEMHRIALAIRRKLFTSDSQQVAESLNDLGVELMAEQRFSEAEAVVTEALRIRRRRLGQENAATATSLNDLGAVYRQLGRLAEGESMAREALAIRRKLFGEEHLDVADSLRNLCITLGNEGKWRESEALARDVLSIRRKLLGLEHPWVASALGDLAWATAGMGRIAEAEALNREALAMRQKLLPGTHPDVAKSLYDVSDMARQQGRLNEADSLLSAALSLQRKVLGAGDPATLNTLHSLGLTLEGEGKWQEAQAVHREALELWRKRAGDEDQQTLYAMRNLATSLEGEHKWSEAETLHREALASWRKVRGNDDPQTLYAMYRFSTALEAVGKLPEAEACRREALEIWRKRAGNEYPQTLYAMRDLAASLESQHKWPEVESLHRESLGAWRKVRGNLDAQTLYTLSKLAAALEAQGKFAEAGSARVEALVAYRSRGDGETAQALEELKALVRVLNLQKKYGEAESILDAALTPEFINKPSSVDILGLRLDLLGSQGRWKEAVADAARIVKLQPIDHEKYHTLAPLLVVTHDETAYKQLCNQMLHNFGDTKHSYIADRVAKSCLISPNSGVDLQRVDKLADTALTAGEDDQCMPLFKMCKGLSMLRLEKYKEAIDWTEKSLNSPFVHAKAQAYAILAIAHWRLGHKAEARDMLMKGNALAPPEAAADAVAQAEGKWFPRLLARIQLNEANSLVRPDLPRVSTPEKEN